MYLCSVCDFNMFKLHQGAYVCENCGEIYPWQDEKQGEDIGAIGKDVTTIKERQKTTIAKAIKAILGAILVAIVAEFILDIRANIASFIDEKMLLWTLDEVYIHEFSHFGYTLFFAERNFDATHYDVEIFFRGERVLFDSNIDWIEIDICSLLDVLQTDMGMMPGEHIEFYVHAHAPWMFSSTSHMAHVWIPPLNNIVLDGTLLSWDRNEYSKHFTICFIYRESWQEWQGEALRPWEYDCLFELNYWEINYIDFRSLNEQFVYHGINTYDNLAIIITEHTTIPGAYNPHQFVSRRNTFGFQLPELCNLRYPNVPSIGWIYSFGGHDWRVLDIQNEKSP